MLVVVCSRLSFIGGVAADKLACLDFINETYEVNGEDVDLSTVLTLGGSSVTDKGLVVPDGVEGPKIIGALLNLLIPAQWVMVIEWEKVTSTKSMTFFYMDDNHVGDNYIQWSMLRLGGGQHRLQIEDGDLTQFQEGNRYVQRFFPALPFAGFLDNGIYKMAIRRVDTAIAQSFNAEEAVNNNDTSGSGAGGAIGSGPLIVHFTLPMAQAWFVGPGTDHAPHPIRSICIYSSDISESQLDDFTKVTSPSAAQSKLSTAAPTVTIKFGGFRPATAQLKLSATALTVFIDYGSRNIVPASAQRLLSSTAPSVFIGTAIIPAAVQRKLSTAAPTVAISDNKRISPTAAQGGLSSNAPTVTIIGTHRYWRLNVTDNNSSTHNIAGLMELQMHTGSTGFGTDQCEGGTASADTEFSASFVASNGFDGAISDVSDNSWSSTDTAFPHWLKYDFGSGNNKDVVGISIIARAVNADSIDSTPRDFDIQYSDDGSSFTTLWSESGKTWSSYQFQHFKRAGAASYTGSPHGTHAHWRIKIVEDDGGTISSASEIEMRATPGGSDQCTGGTPISNGDVGFPDDNAFDNNNSTFFASTTTGDAVYIGYSFASAVSVAEITWRNRGDSAANQAPKTFFVQYADSSSGPWTTAWGVRNSTGWSLGETRTFTDPFYV